MTPVAPHIEAFLREHLARHRGASQHTCDSYAYSFQSLFTFASRKLKVAPSALLLQRRRAPKCPLHWNTLYFRPNHNYAASGRDVDAIARSISTSSSPRYARDIKSRTDSMAGSILWNSSSDAATRAQFSIDAA